MKMNLTSGREIKLRSLTQWHHYYGLLEGLPTREMNRKTIERIVADNSKLSKPYLVSPEEEPLDYIEGRKYPFGDPAIIPPVACIATFHSIPAVSNNSEMFASELVVIWFQQEFALPIEKGVFEHLQALDWENLASDIEY